MSKTSNKNTVRHVTDDMSPEKRRKQIARGVSDFEHHVKEQLASHDRILSRLDERFEKHIQNEEGTLTKLEQKLDAPILNGGFDNLLTQVTRIESVQTELGKCQGVTSDKITAIHTSIYDPEKGLYAKVKDALNWINNVNWVLKGMLGLTATGGVAVLGKIIYGLATGHIHWSP